AAFEARERHVRRRLHRRCEGGETTGADCEYGEHSIHLITSLLRANPAASFSTISSTLMNISVGDKAANRSGRLYPQVTAPNEMPTSRAASRSLISSPIKITSSGRRPRLRRIARSLTCFPKIEAPQA